MVVFILTLIGRLPNKFTNLYYGYVGLSHNYNFNQLYLLKIDKTKKFLIHVLYTDNTETNQTLQPNNFLVNCLILHRVYKYIKNK